MQDVTCVVEKLVYGGKGLAHWNGEAVFIPFVVPGETIRARLLSKRQKIWEAECLEVLEPAADRVQAPCPYFGRCGGCQWQHLSYESQLQWKQKIVAESLMRLGKIENPKVLPTLASPKIWGWRSRILVHGDGQGLVGFYEPDSRKVVDVERCRIADDAVNAQLAGARKTLATQKADLELRSDARQGFSQVNPGQNEQLKKLLQSLAGPLAHEHVVELFCGDGNFSRLFLDRARIFVGVDSSSVAIQHAIRTLAPLHPRNLAHFFCDDAAQWWSRYQPQTPVDLLLLDPPRDGCAKMVEGVMKHRPKNILYISCNPATLARDLKFLKDFAGYSLVQTQPIDMFPHSYHIESLSWISKETA